MAILSRSRQLRKELSLFSVYTIATGATLSSGFFLLPGLAASEAGPAVVLSYLLAIPPLLPGILSKIELATAMPRAGGEYYFLDRSLGPLVGTVGGLGTWCGLVLKTAFALIGIGAYLHPYFPDLPVGLLAAAIAILLGILNLFGARKSGAIQTVLVLGLLLLLFWFVGAGLGRVESAHFSGFLEKGWYQVIAVSGMVSISFMGLSNVASIAEEVRNPERNLKWGILLALMTAILVYGVGTFVIVGVVPPDRLNGSLTSVADAAGEMVGRGGAVIMTVAAVLAFLSVANAGILSASRYPLAMSRDQLLPHWLQRLSRQKTPQNAVMITVGMILLCVLTFDPVPIAKLASTFLLLLFALNCLAVLIMRESRIESYDPGFRCPWYPWLQIIGVLAPLALIVVMGWFPMLFTAGLITVGTAWYFYYARPRVARGGAIFHLFGRLGQRRFEGLDRELRSILKEKGLRELDPYDEIVVRAEVLDEKGSVTFEQVVRKASQQLALHLPQSADQLFFGIMEGTRVGATPVSKGAALPHLRIPGLDHPLMVLARILSGVHVEGRADFVDHSSEQAIHAVIFLVSPEEDAALHLRILAQVARHVDDEHFMTDWLAARDENRLKEILVREDRFLVLDLVPGSPAGSLAGQAVRDLKLPEGLLVALLNRGDETIVPSGQTVLMENDRLTILGLPDSIQELGRRVAGGSRDET